MTTPKPKNLEKIDPRSRSFPTSWKDALIRLSYQSHLRGIQCIGCSKVFSTLQELKLLEADHIDPFSQGGRTVWENMQLLCRPCNRSKSDKK